MDRGQRTVYNVQWTVDSGQRREDSGQWTEDRGQWTVDSGQWTVDSGQWTVDSRQYLRYFGDTLVVLVALLGVWEEAVLLGAAGHVGGLPVYGRKFSAGLANLSRNSSSPSTQTVAALKSQLWI